MNIIYTYRVITDKLFQFPLLQNILNPQNDFLITNSLFIQSTSVCLRRFNKLSIPPLINYPFKLTNVNYKAKTSLFEDIYILQVVRQST